MAKPRVFVSSTYYDLRQIRENVGSFIQNYGFEEVMFEHGHVAYGATEAPAEYCYEEVGLCDILISIIGRRFGANSTDEKYSISQTELRHAMELGKPVYIFVEKAILHEYSTYKENKKNNELVLSHVDDRRVYEFLEELYSFTHNNPIFGFEYAHEIIDILRKQWAGSFLRSLRSPVSISHSQEVLHPAFVKLRDIPHISHPVFREHT